jgi:hypothetical protein
MEEWPPANYNYSKVLEEKKYRQVELIKWKLEPNIDN